MERGEHQTVPRPGLQRFVADMPDGSTRAEFAVEGVRCAACMTIIERGLAPLPGVASARLNFSDRRLAVTWEPEAAPDVPTVLAALDALGYVAQPFAPDRLADAEAAETKRLIRALAVAGFASMNVMLLAISVWAGNVSDMTPENRDLFPLDPGAHRAAGGGLCGPPLLRRRLPRAEGRPGHHGLPDHPRRRPDSGDVCGGIGVRCHARLLRRRRDAVVLPADRAGSSTRPCGGAHAPSPRTSRRCAASARRSPSRTAACAMSPSPNSRPRAHPGPAGRAGARPMASSSTAPPTSTRAWSPARPPPSRSATATGSTPVPSTAAGR